MIKLRSHRGTYRFIYPATCEHGITERIYRYESRGNETRAAFYREQLESYLPKIVIPF